MSNDSAVHTLDCQATPGVTTWAGIRQDAGGVGVAPSLPASAKNSSPLLDTLTPLNVPPYLDVGDNVNANVHEWLNSKAAQFNVEKWLNNNCSEQDFFIPGECSNGHKFGKVSVCGKEWCPVCGQKQSVAHNRRFVRWLPKIQTFRRMRYLVFTIPENKRGQFRTKESLRTLQRAVRDLLKRQGFDRGLIRYHFFGDKSHKWHPHLNALVEGGYMNGATLAAIKQGYADILGVEVVSVRTSYKPRPADMAGSLFYVTRATFKDWQWDVDMAIELHNFRNMVVWGRNWPDPVWSLTIKQVREIAGEKINVQAVEKLTEHTCPVCGAPVTWRTALPGALLRIVDTESYGAGYFRVLERKPPPLESTILTRLAFETGKHGEDCGIGLHHVRKVRGKEDLIEEIRYQEMQARKSKARHSRYLEDLAWLEVAVDMGNEGNNAV